MGIITEFRDFAIKGNMIDMAVGIIIGGAFGAVVTSLVGDVMKPPIDHVVGQFTPGTEGWKWSLDEGGKHAIDLSRFVTVIIGFLITAFAVFLLVKAINTARKLAEKEKAAAPPPAPAEEVVLLREIRDALKSR
jgi:large conductance mechanosensitive channel